MIPTPNPSQPTGPPSPSPGPGAATVTPLRVTRCAGTPGPFRRNAEARVRARSRFHPAVLLATVLVASWLVPRPAGACGPYVVEARFWPAEASGVDWERYAAGELGVLVPGQDPWPLYVAWRHLAGPRAAGDGSAPAADTAPADTAPADTAPLSPGDVAVLADLRHPRVAAAGEPASDPPAVQLWLEARRRVPGAGGDDSPRWIETTRWVERPQPDGSVEHVFFVNCLDDAFLTAVRTLDARIAEWGVASPEVAEWLRGQDRVFANCAADPPPPADLEGEAVPTLLLQDRAYQQAAALFYALDYAGAEARFRTIGDDPTSPWQQVARYLVARTQARDGRPREAVKTLRRLLDDPRQAPFHESIRGLIDHYRQRYEPSVVHRHARAALLASPLPTDLAQVWTDYRLTRPQAGDRRAGDGAVDEGTVAGGTANGGAQNGGTAAVAETGAGLDRWLETLAGEPGTPATVALERWRATRSRPWLVAALARAPGPRLDVHGGRVDSTPPAAAEPDAPSPAWSEAALDALRDAAGRVAVGAPEDLTAAWHQGRLLLGRGWYPEVRALADDVLAHGGPDGGPLDDLATRNRFSALRAEAASGLDDFVRHSQLRPWDVGVDQGRWFPVDGSLREGIGAEPPVLLTTTAVMALNALSVDELAELVRGDLLHPDVRRRVTLAAWTRATLVGRYDLARNLAPWVAAAEPALAVDMEDWVRAEDDELHFLAALIALRFPGLHPDLHVGLPRETPVAEIDELRQNWWCEGFHLVTPEWFVAPPFLAAAPPELLEARAFERRILAAQEPAPRHLGLAVLERADTRPDDPRLPEALHRVVQATRHGCPLPEGGYGRVSRAAFQRLHQRYPDNPWTARTPYWFD